MLHPRVRQEGITLLHDANTHDALTYSASLEHPVQGQRAYQTAWAEEATAGCAIDGSGDAPDVERIVPLSAPGGESDARRQHDQSADGALPNEKLSVNELELRPEEGTNLTPIHRQNPLLTTQRRVEHR
jgi:hypothetical protein